MLVLGFSKIHEDTRQSRGTHEVVFLLLALETNLQRGNHTHEHFTKCHAEDNAIHHDDVGPALARIGGGIATRDSRLGSLNKRLPFGCRPVVSLPSDAMQASWARTSSGLRTGHAFRWSRLSKRWPRPNANGRATSRQAWPVLGPQAFCSWSFVRVA